jgi:hypothetical protein
VLLGDVLARFEDEAYATEALFTIDDIVLTTRISEAAAEEDLTPGEFAIRLVRRFVNDASDEEWLTLVGLISRAENPGQVFLRRVLSNALPVAPPTSG